MHCLTMQHNRFSVTSCHRHGFMLPPIFWLKMRWRYWHLSSHFKPEFPSPRIGMPYLTCSLFPLWVACNTYSGCASGQPLLYVLYALYVILALAHWICSSNIDSLVMLSFNVPIKTAHNKLPNCNFTVWKATI